jgi:hypothetical protein
MCLHYGKLKLPLECTSFSGYKLIIEFYLEIICLKEGKWQMAVVCFAWSLNLYSMCFLSVW